MFKCQTGALNASVSATGGAAGAATGTVNVSSRSGGAGGSGRIHVDYLTSISGTTSPTLDSRQDSSLTQAGLSQAGLLFFMS